MLRNLDLPPILTSDTNDLVRELLIPGLQHSTEYVRAVGYFRTSAFAVAAQGLSAFINGGGSMRLLLGSALADCDRQTGLPSDALLHEIRDGLLTAERVVKDHVALLGALLQEGRLEIRIAVGAVGMFHAKIGRFAGDNGDSLIFHGSANETASGWRGNLEQVSIHRSWYPAERAHHEALSRSIDGWWSGRTAEFRVVPLPEILSETLIDVSRHNPPLAGKAPAALVSEPMNPVLCLAELLKVMPEEEALQRARFEPHFEGSRIHAHLSMSQVLELAWRHSEAMA